MRMLELYSGTGRMAAAFRLLGYKTLTVDLFFESDFRKDVLALQRHEIVERLGGEPQVIWASPPCTSFSVASIGHHWTPEKTPKTPEAHLGLALLRKTLEVVSWFPKARFFIENPRGMMRNIPELQRIPRRTITFCKYGESRMKPTDIWTNTAWIPRDHCKNGDPCHVRAPRGARTGTQGIKGAYDRGALPHELCKEVASFCARTEDII